MREPVEVLKAEEIARAKRILLKFRTAAIERKSREAQVQVEHVIWVMSELYRRAMKYGDGTVEAKE